MGTVSFAVNVDGAGYQLSNSCLQSAIDAGQIRDGPLNFWERVGLKNICIATELKNIFCGCHIDVKARTYVRTAIYALVTLPITIYLPMSTNVLSFQHRQ